MLEDCKCKEWRHEVTKSLQQDGMKNILEVKWIIELSNESFTLIISKKQKLLECYTLELNFDIMMHT